MIWESPGCGSSMCLISDQYWFEQRKIFVHASFQASSSSSQVLVSELPKPPKQTDQKQAMPTEASKEKPKVVKKVQQAIPKAKPELPRAGVVDASDYEEPLKELATISTKIQQGLSMEELNAAFEANEFPALKRKKSQIAILKAVERVGEIAVVQEVLAQELPKVEEAHETGLDSVGFQALLTTLSKETHKIEEIITQVQPEDFLETVVEERFAKIIQDSQEMIPAPQVV